MGGFRLGKILGFPVEIRFSFLLLLLFVYLQGNGLFGLLLLGVVFGSVLLHELGHAVIARRRGFPIVAIELHFFGGAARMGRPPSAPRDEIAIAAAGPLVSFALAGLGLGGYAIFSSPALAYFGYINLILGAFNLLPALPMDGGRILRAALATRKGRLVATEIAVKVAKVCAVAIALTGLVGGRLFIVALAVLLWVMATAELHAARMWEHLRGGQRPVDGFRNAFHGQPWAGEQPWPGGHPQHGEQDDGGVEVLDRDGRPIARGGSEGAESPDQRDNVVIRDQNGRVVFSVWRW